MAIFVDQIDTHDTDNTGDDTVPPGITGQEWAHAVSTENEAELLGFLVRCQIKGGPDPANMRTPALGALQTYVGLDASMLAVLVANGARRNRTTTVETVGFDSPGGSGPFYEP